MKQMGKGTSLPNLLFQFSSSIRSYISHPRSQKETPSASSEKMGLNLKRIRTKKAISQGDIARELGVSRGFVSTIENGKTNPTLSTISKLAKALNVSTNELLK